MRGISQAGRLTRYSDAVGYMRKRLRFDILTTTVISLRGDRGARKNIVDNKTKVNKTKVKFITNYSINTYHKF